MFSFCYNPYPLWPLANKRLTTAKQCERINQLFPADCLWSQVDHIIQFTSIKMILQVTNIFTVIIIQFMLIQTYSNFAAQSKNSHIALHKVGMCRFQHCSKHIDYRIRIIRIFISIIYIYNKYVKYNHSKSVGKNTIYT